MREQRFSYVLMGNQLMPVLSVLVHNGGNATFIDAVLDTGADATILKTDVARELGLTAQTGTPKGVAGVSGKTGAYVHRAEIQLFDRKVPVHAAFIADNVLPFNLLGRDFFEHHVITFEQKHKRVTVAET